MVIKNVNLETVCGITSTLPENIHPEFAFAGKSNVGKSSLINGIMNRKNYARTSQEPGKTQTINYYNINDEFYLVDLPGYGYAKLPQKSRDELKTLTRDYIHNSPELVMLFVLVDSRHDIGSIDLDFMAELGENGIPFGIIYTKCDKQGPNVLAAQIARDEELMLRDWEVLPPSFRSSSQTGMGRDEILDYIGNILTTL